MGYRVKRVPYVKGPGYKIQFEDRAGGKRVTRDVPRDKWADYGFNPAMSLEDALSQCRSLNAQEELKRRAERRLKIEDRLSEQDLVHKAYLNPLDIAEFERKWLMQRVPESERKRHKLNSYWRAAKDVICALELPIEEWRELSGTFYAHFASRSWSPSYVRKVLAVLNLWGAFQARKYHRMFLEIPKPRGRDAERIADSYYDRKPHGHESRPLTPEALEKAKGSLPPEQYNWLYLTVWLGLRPQEAGSAKDPERTRIKDGAILVYQSKLTSIARAKRWKEIRLVEPEQHYCLEIIKAHPVKRPLNKTIAKYCDAQVTGYGGRKGFADLMLSRGHRIEDIAMWLGHHTIDRTWRNYKERPKAA